MKKFRIFLFLISLITLFLTSCQTQYSLKKQPQAVKGVLDLTNWDFEKDGPVRLDGEWEFYWKKLLKESDFQNTPHLSPDTYAWFPEVWNKILIGGKQIGAEGYASYRLQILPGKSASDLALDIPNMNTAYSLNINGKTVCSNGKVGTSKKAMQPSWRPQIISIDNFSGQCFIIIRVSNYYNRTGGPVKSIIWGKEDQLLRIQRKHEHLEWMLFGSISIMGLYHLGLFLLRKSDPSTLYFGVFCLLIAIRALLTGQQYLYHWFLETIWWSFCIKLEYLTFYAAVPVFTLFAFQFFKREFSKKLIFFISMIGTLASVGVISTPSNIFTHSLTFYQMFALSVILYIIFCVTKALFHRLESSALFLMGFLPLAITIINDILYVHRIVQTGSLVSYGLLSFIFLQSILLSIRFSKAFSSVEQLSGELISKNEELARIDKLKDEFLANTSHELRTPLNGIIGIAESLIDGATGKLSKHTNDNLSMIVISGKRLANLVNDILDFSKMKNRDIQLQLKSVDLKSSVNITLNLSKQLLGQKTIELVNQIPDNLPLVEADENRLQQILSNLVGNAIKFTQKGKVTVFANEENDRIRISITDTGIGISKDEQERIFKSFEQANGSTDREYGGTGLGLSVTKQLVELHGGVIKVESKRGKGSNFSFTLLMAKEQTIDEQYYEELIQSVEIQQEELSPEITESMVPVYIAEDTARNTVLVVDDESVNIQVLQNQLHLHQYRVLTAQNGFEALEILEKEKPDLIILDLMMPFMTGYEICQKVRENHDMTSLPIIMLTAKNQVNDLVEGFKSGANDYLTKPFSKDEMLARVKTHLQLYQFTRTFQKFVPKQFLNRIAEQGIENIELGKAQSATITILFSDIRSFSHLSEVLSPQELMNFLNEYFKRMDEPIYNNNGFIDKFIGDAIMALFDIPEGTDSEAATCAINAAIEMQGTLSLYNQHQVNSGRIPIVTGIGIHTGEVIIGTVGSQDRMDSTVLGDAVNLASRLEGLTKQYHSQIIISSHTWRLIKEDESILWRKLDFVSVKGKNRPDSIFEIFNTNKPDIRDKKQQIFKPYHEALMNYFSQDWDEAINLFKECLKIYPQDIISQMYLGRCMKFKNEPPGKDWNGVQKLTEK